MPHHIPPLSGQSSTSSIEPIFVSVVDAARILALSRWQVYALCDEGRIESHYEGRRRLVRVDSLRAYADSLPKVRSEDA